LDKTGIIEYNNVAATLISTLVIIQGGISVLRNLGGFRL